MTEADADQFFRMTIERHDILLQTAHPGEIVVNAITAAGNQIGIAGVHGLRILPIYHLPGREFQRPPRTREQALEHFAVTAMARTHRLAQVVAFEDADAKWRAHVLPCTACRKSSAN